MCVDKCVAVLSRCAVVVCAATIALATTGPAQAVVVDDFSGDLSAYTKTVVLTNSGDDEATSMTKTNFVVNAEDELEFHSYVTNNKAYQTVLLRDDYSLGIGQRLELDFKYFNDVTPGTSPFAGVGLALADMEAQPFNVRNNLVLVDLNAAYGDGTTTTGRVYGTTFVNTVYTQKRADVKLADVTGLFVARVATDQYSFGYSTSAGNTVVSTLTNANVGGLGSAIGLWSDCRTTAEPLARMDNLKITTLDPVPGAAPVTVLDASTTLSSYHPQYSFDSTFMWDGKPNGSFWGGVDDTGLAGSEPPVTGHVVYDMGTATTLSDLTVWARSSTAYVLPQNVKIFRFANDDPYAVVGAIDDIENDPAVLEVWSGTLRDFNDGVAQSIQFSPFTGRYVGVRIDSSYEKTQANFQVGEVRFNAGDQNPAALPGAAPATIYHASDILADDTDFKPERMIDGLVSARNIWAAEDDDATAPGLNGHVVFDMGAATEVGGVRLWSRKDTARFMLPGEVKLFGFADDNPANILGLIDDIENDPNIIQIWSGSLAAAASGNFADVLFSAAFTGRYLGLRIDSGQADAEYDGNFQISEIRFLTDVVPPVPGDASGDGKVDAADAQLLATNWGLSSGAGWGNGDFNGDGQVNAADASILAANWGYGVPDEAAGVPEPSCLVLLSAAVIGFAALRRR
jgi:hypothetical protein